MENLENLNYSYQKITLSLENTIINKRIPIAGQRITHNDGTSPISIKLESNTNDEIDLQPQGSIKVPQGFGVIFVSAAQAAGTTIEIIVSSPWDIEFDSNTMTIDEIDTVSNIVSLDKVDEISLINQDISDYYNIYNDKNGFMGSGSAGGSNWNTIGLRNPVSSGVTLIVDSVILSSDTTTHYNFYSYETSIPEASINSGFNKYIGESDSLGKIEVKVASSMLGINILKSCRIINGIYNELLNNKKIIIPEGHGILTVSNITNQNNVTSFEWREI